jgi:hypothetical protein
MGSPGNFAKLGFLYCELIWLYMARESLPNIAIDTFSPPATMVNGLAEASFKDIPEIFEVYCPIIRLCSSSDHQHPG